MQIDNAAIVLRPRGHWEAMDMGFLFARRHFLSLWLLWCATAIPVFVLLNVCLINYLEYVTLVFWWLKPLFEVLLVAWLGKALFNNPPTVVEQLKQFPDILKQGVFSQLSWRRFSLSRSFNMPVFFLEHAHGSDLNQRLTTLQTTQPHSSWLTILMIHIETVFYFSIPVLVIMLAPGEVEFDYEAIFLLEPDPYYVFLENLVYFISASLIAPFYVSAGFLLYINTRTILEAWDIEIAFRKMPKHSASVTNTTRAVLFAVVFSLTGFGIATTETHAVNRDQAQKTISTVLESDDFGKLESMTDWEPIFDKNKPNETDFNWFWLNHLEWLGIVLKYLALVCIAALAIWMAIKIAEHFDLAIFHKKTGKRLKTTTLPGFLVIDNTQTLPANPVDAATMLCNQNRYREALSLLYRVSLIQFIEQHQVVIPASATEQECLQIIKQHSDTALFSYFSTLTINWQWLAWANQDPSEATIRSLCNTWPDHFMQTAHDQ
ncbi:MAG: hypothetical protein V3U88_07125 [Methylococcales bacterium]